MDFPRLKLKLHSIQEKDKQMAELTIKEIEKVIDKAFVKQALMIKNGFDATTKDIADLRNDIARLDAEIKSLNNKINNYLELADKRYLELKKKYLQVVKSLAEIGNRTGVKIDTDELEQFQ